MSAYPTPPHADLIERNMALAFAFIEEQIDQPVTAANVPAGATVILLPDDDPELARFNEALGLNALREGANVYFRHVTGRVPA